MDAERERWTDRQMDKWTNRQMDKQINGQTDKWTNRQTDRRMKDKALNVRCRLKVLKEHKHTIRNHQLTDHSH